MIIDTHCHYNLPPLLESETGTWKDHWQRAQAAGVTDSVLIGVDYESSRQAAELTLQEPKFKAAVGCHPHAIQEGLYRETNPLGKIAEWMNQLRYLIVESEYQENIVAVGETGLDYFNFDAKATTSKTEVALQQHLFIEHIKLANRHDLPLLLHVRDHGKQAYKDVLSLLKVNKKTQKPFVLHCVSGPLDYIAEAVAIGAYIGIAGNCTYKNAEHIREIIRQVPKDRLLLETDAPFLPPMPHRGKICEPWMIQLTASFIEENFGCSLEQIYSNTYQVFPKLRHHE